MGWTGVADVVRIGQRSLRLRCGVGTSNTGARSKDGGTPGGQTGSGLGLGSRAAVFWLGGTVCLIRLINQGSKSYQVLNAPVFSHLLLQAVAQFCAN